MENYNNLSDYKYKLTQGMSIGEDVQSVYDKMPERNLLTAILERAVLDLEHKDKHIRRDAEIWFDSDNSTEVLFSYRFICNHLDLNPVKIKSLSFKRRDNSMLRNKYK